MANGQKESERNCIFFQGIHSESSSLQVQLGHSTSVLPGCWPSALAGACQTSLCVSHSWATLGHFVLHTVKVSLDESTRMDLQRGPWWPCSLAPRQHPEGVWGQGSFPSVGPVPRPTYWLTSARSPLLIILKKILSIFPATRPRNKLNPKQNSLRP